MTLLVLTNSWEFNAPTQLAAFATFISMSQAQRPHRQDRIKAYQTHLAPRLPAAKRSLTTFSTKPRPQSTRRLRLSTPSRSPNISRSHLGTPLPPHSRSPDRLRNRGRALALLPLPPLQHPHALSRRFPLQTPDVCSLLANHLSLVLYQRNPLSAAMGHGSRPTLSAFARQGG